MAVPSDVRDWLPIENATLAVLSICKTPNWEHIAAFMHSQGLQPLATGHDMQTRFGHLRRPGNGGKSRWVQIDRIKSLTWHWTLPGGGNITAQRILRDYRHWKLTPQAAQFDFADEYLNDLSAPNGEGHPKRGGVYVGCLQPGCFASQGHIVSRRNHIDPGNQAIYNGLSAQRRLQIFGTG